MPLDPADASRIAGTTYDNLPLVERLAYDLVARRDPIVSRDAGHGREVVLEAFAFAEIFCQVIAERRATLSQPQPEKPTNDGESFDAELWLAAHATSSIWAGHLLVAPDSVREYLAARLALMRPGLRNHLYARMGWSSDVAPLEIIAYYERNHPRA